MENRLSDAENLNALINLISNDSFLDYFHQIVGQKLQNLLKTRNQFSLTIYDPESFGDVELINFLVKTWR
jgi:hypothetical protein